VVPKGPFDPNLRPYVSKQTTLTESRLKEWPVARSRSKEVHEAFPEGIYGPNVFDGHYLLQLSDHLADPENERILSDNHLAASVDDPQPVKGIVGDIPQIELPSERKAIRNETFFESQLEQPDPVEVEALEDSPASPSDPSTWLKQGSTEPASGPTPPRLKGRAKTKSGETEGSL